MSDSSNNSAKALINDFLNNVVSVASAIANEKVIEPTLADDPSLHESLAKLANKVIAFEIKKVGQTLYFLPTESRLEITHDQPETIDVTVRTTLGAVAKIAKDGMDKAELESGELEIEGDAITGQRFAKLLGELDIDWEELASRRIGDVPANLLFKGLSSLKNWSAQTSQNMKQTTSEYLVEEARILASQVLVDKYLDDVDALRNDVARLASRVKKIQNKS